MSVEVGNIVKGKVTGITDFGAFVKLPNGKTGLVHISEIADTYVKDINNYVDRNETVKVKVLSIKEGGEKIGLSIRKALTEEEKERNRQRALSFEDKLSEFKKESDRKLQDLERQKKSRRGSSGKRNR